MRVEVEIAGERRPLSEADPQWVHEQIGNRQRAGQAVCARVYVTGDGLDFVLSTPTCRDSGGHRRASPEELPFVELWRKRGLDQEDFTSGHLIAFLQQLKR